jgi:hypothetical protein
VAAHNPSRLAVRVGARAGYRCEYCLTPHAITAQTFHADHILPQSRGGKTILDNLCFACPRCNLRKGDLIEGRDPEPIDQRFCLIPALKTGTTTSGGASITGASLAGPLLGAQPWRRLI